MKNKIFEVLSVLIFSASFAHAIPLPIDPTIRFAQGHVAVFEKVMSLNPKTGEVSTASELKCEGNLKVPVWADVTGDYSYTPAEFSCASQVAGQSITLISKAALKFSTAQLFPNSPPEKFKEGMVWNSFSSPTTLAEVPNQTITTRDLHLKSFVIQSSPVQSVNCSTSAPSSCIITNPEVLTVLWDITDSE